MFWEFKAIKNQKIIDGVAKGKKRQIIESILKQGLYLVEITEIDKQAYLTLQALYSKIYTLKKLTNEEEIYEEKESNNKNKITLIIALFLVGLVSGSLLWYKMHQYSQYNLKEQHDQPSQPARVTQ